MRLAYLNPNATGSMTAQVVAAAQAALPEARVTGWTNAAGPPAIQGPEDGRAALPGLRALARRALAQGADALVIACFDDTGLAEIRDAAPCPVLGIGQAAYHMAALVAGRFSVVTTLPVSVPVLEANIAQQGFGAACLSVRASGLEVLQVEQGGAAVIDRLAEEIAAAEAEGAGAVALGCAGMAPLRAALARRAGVPLIDGVAAAAHLARAALAQAGP